jgi:hypothetical protein
MSPHAEATPQDAYAQKLELVHIVEKLKVCHLADLQMGHSLCLSTGLTPSDRHRSVQDGCAKVSKAPKGVVSLDCCSPSVNWVNGTQQHRRPHVSVRDVLRRPSGLRLMLRRMAMLALFSEEDNKLDVAKSVFCWTQSQWQKLGRPSSTARTDKRITMSDASKWLLCTISRKQVSSPVCFCPSYVPRS